MQIIMVNIVRDANDEEKKVAEEILQSSGKYEKKLREILVVLDILQNK
jgi:hypothetical protein